MFICTNSPGSLRVILRIAVLSLIFDRFLLALSSSTSSSTSTSAPKGEEIVADANTTSASDESQQESGAEGDIWPLARFLSMVSERTSKRYSEYRLFSKDWIEQHRYSREGKYGVSECNAQPDTLIQFKVHVPDYKPKVPIQKKVSFRERDVPHTGRRVVPTSELPKLPLEPFQRLMTYAIEGNLISDLWFLELIYCLYRSVSFHLEGVAMSYTLQELIGTALLTIDYKTEDFLIELCFSSVQAFKDDKISSKHVEICNSMLMCLNEKQFLSKEFSEISETLHSRINNAYKSKFVVKNLEGTYGHKLFAKYALLLSIANFNKEKVSTSYNSYEKNYLVVASMNASLAVRCLAMFAGCTLPRCADHKIINFAFGLVDNIKDFTGDMAVKECIEHLELINMFKKLKYYILSEFCVGLLSLGFIDENIVYPGDIEPNLLSNAIMPSRILHPHYYSVIPNIASPADDVFSSPDWIYMEQGEEHLTSVKKGLIKKSFSVRKISSKTSRASVPSRTTGKSLGKEIKSYKRSQSRIRTLIQRTRTVFKKE